MNHVRIALCEVEDPVVVELRKFGITALIGEDMVFHTLEDAIAMHRRFHRRLTRAPRPDSRACQRSGTRGP